MSSRPVPNSLTSKANPEASADPAPRYKLRERTSKPVLAPSSTAISKAKSQKKPRPKKMANEAVKRFFSSPNFAVAGASTDINKYGYKILAWYHGHSIPATPLNPRAQSITLSTLPNSPSIPTLPSPSALPNPADTSLSLVTPPPVTLSLLKEAKKSGIKHVWLQPGTFDDSVMAYLKGQAEGEDKGGFESWLAGFEKEDGERGPGGGEGWCVLVDGERGLRSAGKDWARM